MPAHFGGPPTMSQTALTLAPSAIAVIIAVVVPWFTFRLALRQDRDRRQHDQRAQLYMDLLTEAYAETKQFEHEIADAGIPDRPPLTAARASPAWIAGDALRESLSQSPVYSASGNCRPRNAR